MTPDEKKLLAQTFELAQENNKILRGIRNSTRWSIAFKVVYWGAIIALSFGAYYFIQPYVNTLKDSITEVQKLGDGVKGTIDQVQKSSSMLKDLVQ